MRTFTKLLAALLLVSGSAYAVPPSVQLPALSPTGDASATTIRPTGVPSPYQATLATITAQSGILLDLFKLSGDVDDTASLTRACAAGVPVLLGPRVYIINDYGSGSGCSALFALKGVPAKSVVQRTSAAGGSWISISSASVYIDGVIFDANKAALPSANEWGVILPPGGQVVVVKNSVFKNNSGSLGSCFILKGTGPAAGGAFNFTDNELSGCGFNGGAWFASVSNGVVKGNRFHDNQTNGVTVSSYLAASPTNYSTNIAVVDNLAYNNANNGISIGGIGPPYNFQQSWGASYVLVQGNTTYDNLSAQIGNQGDHIDVLNNLVEQIYASSVTYGILCNSAYSRMNYNRVLLPNTGYGFDCGGAIEPSIQHNHFTMATGAAANIGGTQNAMVSDNTMDLTGTAYAVNAYAIEGDGSGVAFPTYLSGLRITRNFINQSGSGTRTIAIWDNGGAFPGTQRTVINDNDVTYTNGASAYYGVYSFVQGVGLAVYGNRVNGITYSFVDPDVNGDIIFDDLFDDVQTTSNPASNNTVRSVISRRISVFGAGGSILAVYPTTTGGTGTGYAVNDPVTVTCTGSNPTGYTGFAEVDAGVIYGVRTNNMGTGASGTCSASVTSTSGTGASLAVLNYPSIPSEKTLTLHFNNPTVLQAGGGYVGINSAAGSSYFMQQSGNRQVVLSSGYSGVSSSGGNWAVTTPPPTAGFTYYSGGSFTGTISGNTLTFPSNTGTVAASQFLTGAGVPAFTRIISGSGLTWTTNGPSLSLTSVAMTSSAMPPCNTNAGTGSFHARIEVFGTATGASSMFCTTVNGVTGWVFPNGYNIDVASAISGSIGGSALAAGACASGTVTMAGLTTSQALVASPTTYPGDNYEWRAYPSASNTATVKVCAISAGTPTASTYSLRVLQ